MLSGLQSPSTIKELKSTQLSSF